MHTPIRTATLEDIPGAAATLAEAFDDYPWTRWSLPSHDYAARLERVQELYLRHALANGIVLVAEDLSGVAALLPPDCPAPPEPVQAEVAEFMGDRAAIVFGVELPARSQQSWDLATVGVRPAQAGQGIGVEIEFGITREADESPASRSR